LDLPSASEIDPNLQLLVTPNGDSVVERVNPLAPMGFAPHQASLLHPAEVVADQRHAGSESAGEARHASGPLGQGP
jgi:hypothetical protein